MSNEFGHISFIGGGVCMDAWGAGPFELEVAGKVVTFEDSDRFGPAVLNKNGAPKMTQPGERSPFWEAHRTWVEHGRHIGQDGKTCMLFGPDPPANAPERIR